MNSRPRFPVRTAADFVAAWPALKRRGSSTPARWDGPCPACQDGDDRFHVEDRGSDAALFGCRHCVDGLLGDAKKEARKAILQALWPATDRRAAPRPARRTRPARADADQARAAQAKKRRAAEWKRRRAAAKAATTEPATEPAPPADDAPRTARDERDEAPPAPLVPETGMEPLTPPGPRPWQDGDPTPGDRARLLVECLKAEYRAGYRPVRTAPVAPRFQTGMNALEDGSPWEPGFGPWPEPDRPPRRAEPPEPPNNRAALLIKERLIQEGRLECPPNAPNP